MKNAFLLEQANAKQIFAPVDLNTAAVTGARISMAKGDRVAVVLSLGDSTAATLEVTFKQHNAASAGTTKALEIMNKYYHKAGAATSFTEVAPTVVDDVFDLSSVFAGEEGILVFEVRAEDLDVNNGYAWMSINIADSAAAKIGAGLYIIHDANSLPAYSVAL